MNAFTIAQLDILESLFSKIWYPDLWGSGTKNQSRVQVSMFISVYVNQQIQ